MRGGLLLLVLGAWLVSRTLLRDDQGNNLVDKILAHTGDQTFTDNQTVDANGNAVQRSVAPNRLAAQMSINNTRLRVQQAFRLGQTPAAADVALLRKTVPGFNLATLKSNTVGIKGNLIP